MKNGIVITMRFNPQDVMGLIDIVDKSGAYYPGMSMSQCAKVAITGMLEAYRRAGTISARDGFEFTEMVRRFTNVAYSRKRAVTETMEATEVARQIIDKPHVSHPAPSPVPIAKFEGDAFDQAIIKKGRLLIKAQELEFKRTADPDNFDAAEAAQLKSLEDEIAAIDQQLGQQ